MKKVTNHNQEYRRRVQLKRQGPQLTDPSFKKACDINNIVAQYQKTGLLPSVNKALGQFLDNTNLMTLEEAHGQISHAKALFMELPAQLRKLMDNDPRKLESFMQDPANGKLLLEHGILIPRPAEKVKDSPKENPNPPPAGSPDPKS